jgi:hypothetical protein
LKPTSIRCPKRPKVARKRLVKSLRQHQFCTISGTLQAAEREKGEDEGHKRNEN